jgi:hypothetical protein
LAEKGEDRRRAENHRSFERIIAEQLYRPYNVAAIYAGLGDKDPAFAWLDRAYKERSSMLTLYLTNDPRMDSVRSDPRFAELVRGIGLPQ